MNSSIANALLGMGLLAIPFAIVGRYLKHISSEVMTPIVYAAGLLILAPLGFFLAKTEKVVVTSPSVGQGAVIAVCGILLGLGDYFTVKAFNSGGSTLAIAAIIALMPCAAAIIVAILGGGLPGWRTWAGWALAAIAIVLIRGEPVAR